MEHPTGNDNSDDNTSGNNLNCILEWWKTYCCGVHYYDVKQLLDEVEHDIMNYQNRGLCYLPKSKAEADNTDTRF